MEYSRIVAVTGLPGLYEVVSSKTDGAIVRSLEDQSTKFISSRIHNLSHLESIEVYTVNDNITLADIFLSMKESGQSLPDTKDNKVLKSYFENVYPDLDFDRVYSSDLKKMVKWYEVLKQNNVDFTAKSVEKEEETSNETPEVPKEKPQKEKTKTKTAEPVAEKAPKEKKEKLEKVTKPAAEKTPATSTKNAKPKPKPKEKSEKKAAAAPKKAAKKK